MTRQTAMRTVAIIMVMVAVAWGIEIVHEAVASNGEGPPLGAICMSLPAIALMAGAGLVWSAAQPRG